MNITGKVQIENTKSNGETWVSPWMCNLVVLSEDHGGNLVIKRLGGSNQYSMNITHGDIGVDGTAPNDADTQLGDAKARAVGFKTDETTDSVTFRFFFPDSLVPNDTYKEFGAFIDGGNTINTGQMWNRLLFDIDYTKSSGEDTTVSLVLSINN